MTRQIIICANGREIGRCNTVLEVRDVEGLSECDLQGFEPRDTTDWHDLTAAIKAGEPIDWEALDGRRVKCEHEELGTLSSTMERHSTWDADSHMGWLNDYGAWGRAISDAWHGAQGWTLYIDGPIPLKRKTADQLKPGERATIVGGTLGTVLLGTRTNNGLLLVNDGSYVDASTHWTVIKEHGKFEVSDDE